MIGLNCRRDNFPCGCLESLCSRESYSAQEVSLIANIFSSRRFSKMSRVVIIAYITGAG